MYMSPLQSLQYSCVPLHPEVYHDWPSSDNDIRQSDDARRMARVSCVIIAPRYDYLGHDQDLRKFHDYLIQVQVMPKPLGQAFYTEIHALTFQLGQSNIAGIHIVSDQARVKNIAESVRKATCSTDVLFVVFVGHGTPDKGMMLQDRQSMTRQHLHQLANQNGFKGTLIEVFCMCHAQGPEYTAAMDAHQTVPLTIMEKDNSPLFSVYSSTYATQKYSVGLAFLRKFRKLVFGGCVPKYVDITPTSLMPSDTEIEEARADLRQEDDLADSVACPAVAALDIPVVHVCGHDIDNQMIRERLADAKLFDPLPADLIPSMSSR